jgi:hypothetical protein
MTGAGGATRQGGEAHEDLEALEAAVSRALERGDASALQILGYGEISAVVAWPIGGRQMACKRLPPFADTEALEAYRGCVEVYLERLEASGLRPVETEVLAVRGGDGRPVAYCVQPVLPPGSVLHEHLRGCDDEAALALFDRVLDHVARCLDGTLGIDAQVSNWVATAGGLLYLDVSTPMIRDERGRECLDTGLFLASLPWAMRGLVRRFMLGAILDKYYSPRGAVVDLLGNLLKERLDRLFPVFLARANRSVSPKITEAEVRAYYRGDARMWALLQSLRRTDRAWQRRVRRRVYPFLLPGRISR